MMWLINFISVVLEMIGVGCASLIFQSSDGSPTSPHTPHLPQTKH